MAEFVVPARVAEFIRTYIDSVGQLEALLLLRRQRKAWNTETIAAELRSSHPAASNWLRRLAVGGFVSVVAPGTYQYVSGPLDEVISELDAAYRDGPRRVIQLIFSKPGHQVF